MRGEQKGSKNILIKVLQTSGEPRDLPRPSGRRLGGGIYLGISDPGVSCHLELVIVRAFGFFMLQIIVKPRGLAARPGLGPGCNKQVVHKVRTSINYLTLRINSRNLSRVRAQVMYRNGSCIPNPPKHLCTPGPPHSFHDRSGISGVAAASAGVGCYECCAIHGAITRSLKTLSATVALQPTTDTRTSL